MFGETRLRPSFTCPMAVLCCWIATAVAASAQPPNAPDDECAPLSSISPGIHAPADFAVAVDGATKRLQIAPSGEATSWIGRFQGPLRHSPMKYQVEHHRILSPRARDHLYAQVLACRFFDLDRNHTNRNVLDGWGMSVTVTAAGRSHTVGTYMVSLRRLDTIVAAARTEIAAVDEAAPGAPIGRNLSAIEGGLDSAVEASARMARESATPTDLSAGASSGAVSQPDRSRPPVDDGMRPLPDTTDPILARNGTTAAVRPGAARTPRFEIDVPCRIEQITTYHYGARRPPGSLALRSADGRVFGPWRASGAVGQGGVPHAYWWVRPDLTLPAGTYAVVDSDPATWSTQTALHGAGIYEVRGRPTD